MKIRHRAVLMSHKFTDSLQEEQFCTSCLADVDMQCAACARHGAASAFQHAIAIVAAGCLIEVEPESTNLLGKRLPHKSSKEDDGCAFCFPSQDHPRHIWRKGHVA